MELCLRLEVVAVMVRPLRSPQWGFPGGGCDGWARYDLPDFVVFLPGIMGSTLSHDGKLVWGPSAGAALRVVATFGGSINDLQLPESIGDECPREGGIPVVGWSQWR